MQINRILAELRVERNRIDAAILPKLGHGCNAESSRQNESGRAEAIGAGPSPARLTSDL